MHNTLRYFKIFWHTLINFYVGIIEFEVRTSAYWFYWAIKASIRRTESSARRKLYIQVFQEHSSLWESLIISNTALSYYFVTVLFKRSLIGTYAYANNIFLFILQLLLTSWMEVHYSHTLKPVICKSITNNIIYCQHKLYFVAYRIL